MFGSSERVLELLAAREQLDAQLLVELGAWCASREYTTDGAVTATTWLVHHANMTAVEATRLVRNSRLVRTHAHHRRYLHASKTLNGGVRLDGLLDRESGAWVVAALRDRMGTDTSLSAAQRRADALVALARGDEHEVHLDVVIDADRLAGKPPGDLAGARVDLANVGPVARATVRRLACDAHVGRVVGRGPSEILDVGRRQRLVNGAQRGALDVRDGGCVFPGCDRPPGWCDAHYLVHWVDAGTTDLDNLVLLCRHHHTACHERGWTLTRHDDGIIDVQAVDLAGRGQGSGDRPASAFTGSSRSAGPRPRERRRPRRTSRSR